MIYLKQDIEEYDHDFRTMIQAFFPREKIVIMEPGTRLTFRAEFLEEQVR